MPLYALNHNNEIISANQADAFCQYRCVECKSLVRKRTSLERKTHFYHLHTVRTCRLHSQKIDHLIFQTALHEKNPNLIIERPFDKILRIADLCWDDKKIVFEIQCSPINPSEARRRQSDYALEGYQLVWLLDDRLYNRKTRLLPSETDMRTATGYYCCIRRQLIYDQLDVIESATRLMRGPPLPVGIDQPMIRPTISGKLPEQLKSLSTRFFFHGDLWDRVTRHPIYLRRIIELENAVLAEARYEASLSFHLKKTFYLLWEQALSFFIDEHYEREEEENTRTREQKG